MDIKENKVIKREIVKSVSVLWEEACRCQTRESWTKNHKIDIIENAKYMQCVDIACMR